MELSVSCREAGTQWVFLRDDGEVLISTRTVSVALQLANARSLCKTLAANGVTLTDRRAFPRHSLALGIEEQAHFFVLLAFLPQQLNKKYLPTICMIWACVGAELGRRHLEERERRLALEAPNRRSLDSLVAQESLPKRVRSSTIKDVPVPSPTAELDTLAAAAEMALSPALATQPRIPFRNLDFGTPSGDVVASPYVGPRFSSLPPLSVNLRPNVRTSLGFIEAPTLLPPVRKIGGKPEEASLEPFFLDTLQAAQVPFEGGRPVPLVITHPVRAGPFKSNRPIADVQRVTAVDNHVLEYWGVVHGFFGKFCWRVSLGFKEYSSPLASALRYFGLDRYVLLGSFQKGDNRKWYLESDCCTVEELNALGQRWLFGVLPAEPVHPSFASPECEAFAEQHPWLRERGTSLSTDPDPFFSGKQELLLVCREQLNTLLACSKACQCTRRATQLLTVTNTRTVGLAVTITVSCSGCSWQKEVAMHPGDPTVFNRTAYVASATCGRPHAAQRFMKQLGVAGHVVDRDSGRNFSKQLNAAAKSVYTKCMNILFHYFVLSKEWVISCDVVHKRMAKHSSQLGEAYSSSLTIGAPVMGKAFSIFMTDRRDAQKQRTAEKKISMPSQLPGKPDLTSGLGGIEHYTLETGLQNFKQHLDAAVEKVRSSLTLEAQAAHVWHLTRIIIDGLASARNTIARTFPELVNVVKVLCDWWHRRNSSRNLISDCVGKRAAKKEPKFPGFQNLAEALGSVFSDCLFAKRSKEQFIEEVKRLALVGNVDTDRDAEHQQAWNKFLGKMGDLFDEIDVDTTTSINELFHAHLRFYAIKGDPMTPRHWETTLFFAYLSFNRFPGWQKLVLAQFLDAAKQ